MRSIGTLFMRRWYFIEDSNILYFLAYHGAYIFLIFILGIRFWILFFILNIINLWVLIWKRSLVLFTGLFFTKTWDRCVNIRAWGRCINPFRLFKFIRVVLFLFVTPSFKNCICLLITWDLLRLPLGSISTRIRWVGDLFPLWIPIQHIASVSNWITWQGIVVSVSCITFSILGLRKVISLTLRKFGLFSIFFLLD